ncbi:uncharacterized protein LAESUDRAFT_738033 [Laetiporus sulphureus 93-53]|uniref:Uncharacterized protein n=1 Tax=Laetiporus sulphureus 93-53 TaxID=1314785 RepID=A0A165D3A9_9APHY|nr:uncharacterized protein LAESUDRAFT_738033 [Laetiporus sulphureus 93-53]KZT04075.1 hypothetical protein LAESUDRAFT_738033 [Laetiporus sulphureus 93-53]
MSSSLLVLYESLFPLHVAQFFVRYATKKEYVGEQRYEIMRHPNVGRRLQHANGFLQAHDTIEQSFAACQHAMEVLMKISPNLYAEASKEEDLCVWTRKETDFAKTLRISERKTLEARVRGLFPRELRIPTDTQSRDG